MMIFVRSQANRSIVLGIIIPDNVFVGTYQAVVLATKDGEELYIGNYRSMERAEQAIRDETLNVG